MNREEIIDVLIADRFGDWVYARNTDTLAEILRVGWEGFDDYSDKELQEALEGVDIERCKEVMKSGSSRKVTFLKKCPSCKKIGKYVGIGALSRKDNKTMVCSICGLKEALEWYRTRS